MLCQSDWITSREQIIPNAVKDDRKAECSFVANGIIDRSNHYENSEETS